MSRAAIKREIKEQIREFIKEQAEEFLVEQGLAMFGDILGGCGSITMAVQVAQAAKITSMCANLAQQLNRPDDIVQECVNEILNGDH
jgi:hypothetical protein